MHLVFLWVKPPPSGPGARPCSGYGKRTSTAYCNTQDCPGKYHNYNIHSWPSMYHLYHSCTLTYGPVRTNLSQNVRIRTTAVTPVLVHGGWSQWAESGRTECSKSCGTGSQTITETRNCTNPPPSGPGARLCSGDSKRTSTADCNTQECPGKYHNYNIHSWPSMYHLYHSCTLTHGPVRTNLSQNVRIRTTAVTPVSVHGGWSQWAESGRTECFKTCGTGN